MESLVSGGFQFDEKQGKGLKAGITRGCPLGEVFAPVSIRIRFNQCCLFPTSLSLRAFAPNILTYREKINSAFVVNQGQQAQPVCIKFDQKTYVVQLLLQLLQGSDRQQLADFRLRPRRVTRSQVLPEVTLTSSPLQLELFFNIVSLLYGAELSIGIRIKQTRRTGVELYPYH